LGIRAFSSEVETGLRQENASKQESENTKKGGAARRDKTLAAPCRFFAILAGKCGFAGQPERRFDGSNARENGNAIPVLT
jgi:hypothetical protein